MGYISKKVAAYGQFVLVFYSSQTWTMDFLKNVKKNVKIV